MAVKTEREREREREYDQSVCSVIFVSKVSEGGRDRVAVAHQHKIGHLVWPGHAPSSSKYHHVCLSAFKAWHDVYVPSPTYGEKAYTTRVDHWSNTVAAAAVSPSQNLTLTGFTPSRPPADRPRPPWYIVSITSIALLYSGVSVY